MERNDHSTRAVDLHGAGKDGFRPDPRAAGVAASVFTPASANALQEEVCNPIEAVGQTIAAGNTRDQLLRALQFADLVRAMTAAGVIDTTLTDHLKSVACPSFADNNFLAFMVGAAGAFAAIAEDGSTTTETPGSSYVGNFSDVAAVETSGSIVAVAVGASEEIQTYASSTLTRRNTGSDDLNAVALNGLAGVACGANAKILQSTNLTAWTSRTSAQAGTLRGAAFGAGVYVIGGANGLQSSADGITWTSRVGSVSIKWVRYVTGFGFIATATSGNNYYSIDGVTWSTVTLEHAVERFVAIRAGMLGFPLSGDVSMAAVISQTALTSGFKLGRTDRMWRMAAYSSKARGLYLVGDDGAVGYSPMPFGA